MANRAIDLVITYRVIKLLVTPFNRQEAYKYGIIDDKGKVLRKFRTLQKPEEKKAYTLLHRFVFNLKRILQKVGLGGRLGSFAVALGLLIKEDKKYEPYKQIIESAVITYLKQTDQYNNLLNEEGEVPTFEPEQDVFCNCFGIDVYELEDRLVSEKEYAKTL
tara:strand:+ start:71 stop:556 length:486 start_codon:yes stop_codon:yes gene_type:complete